MEQHPVFVLDPNGDPQSRPDLVLEETWWSEPGRRAYHVLVGGVYVGNVGVSPEGEVDVTLQMRNEVTK